MNKVDHETRLIIAKHTKHTIRYTNHKGNEQADKSVFTVVFYCMFIIYNVMKSCSDRMINEP